YHHMKSAYLRNCTASRCQLLRCGGKRQGKWTTLDSLGNLKSTAIYKDDQLDGELIYYLPDGTIDEKRYFVAGEMETSIDTDEQETEEADEVMPYLASCINTDRAEQKACSDKTMLMHIYKNIKYPSRARENGIQGSAIINFNIEKDGRIGDIIVYRGLCREIEAEAIRMIKSLPKWNPGMQNGKPVRVNFSLPIRFRLE
ncbi:MAG: TonB family protein, partial [Bacteroidota bacterium]